MKKRINIEGVLNELRGGSAFFPNYKNDETNSRSEKDEIQDVEGTEAPENKQPPLPSREEDKAFKVAHYNTVDQSVNRSINQSTDQSTSQPTIPLKPNSVSS